MKSQHRLYTQKSGSLPYFQGPGEAGLPWSIDLALHLLELKFKQR